MATEEREVILDDLMSKCLSALRHDELVEQLEALLSSGQNLGEAVGRFWLRKLSRQQLAEELRQHPTLPIAMWIEPESEESREVMLHVAHHRRMDEKLIYRAMRAMANQQLIRLGVED